MNDRFKYRVWDKENKCMHYPSRYHNFSIVNGTIVKIESYPTANSAYLGKRIAWEFDDAVIMQCTGLKDKNEKLIYEGDVVEFYSQSLLDAMSRKGLARRAGQVVWNDEFLKFDVIVEGKAVPDLCKETDDNNFEVIGNIYENKDLLNENS